MTARRRFCVCRCDDCRLAPWKHGCGSPDCNGSAQHSRAPGRGVAHPRHVFEGQPVAWAFGSIRYHATINGLTAVSAKGTAIDAASSTPPVSEPWNHPATCKRCQELVTVKPAGEARL